jgi:bis(5'-adenosyl)-triphosphatase
MPIRCVNTLKDLANDEKEDLFMVLKKVQEVVRSVNGASYVTTGIQTGADSGQTVKHLHVHVLPRKSNVKGLENGKFDVSHDRPERSLDEMSEEASRLRPYFNQ